MKKIVTPKIPKEDVEFVLSNVLDDIVDFLIHINQKLFYHIKQEEYEECIVIKEGVMTFINETSTIINQATKKRRATVYRQLHEQNDLIREIMFDEYLTNKHQ